MVYKCLDCEEVGSCEVPNFPDKIGYVCNLAGENKVDLLEFNGEYMSQRVYDALESGSCELEKIAVEEAIKGII